MEEDDTHEAQQLAVSLATADLALALHDALDGTTLSSQDRHRIAMLAARLSQPALARLAFRAFTLGVDRGEAIGRYSLANEDVAAG